MKKTKILITVAIIAVIIIGLIAFTQVQETKQETMKLGLILMLSGSAAEQGIPALHGATIAKDEINSNGGINGKQIEFIAEDGKCNATDAAAAAQKLTSVNKVSAILTGCSTETLTVAPIAENSKTIVMGVVSTSSTVSNAGDFIFRTAPSDLLGLKKFAEATYSKLGYKKIAVFSELKDYPQGLKNGFEGEFKNLGGTITASETFAEDARDLKTPLLKLAESKPDALVLFTNDTKTGAILLKQAKEINLGLPMLANEVMGGEKILEVAKEEAEGLVFVTPNFDEKREKTKEFLENYRSKYPEDSPPNNLYVAAAYDAVYLLKEAMEKCDTNTECIKNQLYMVKDWEGATGIINIDEKGDPVYDYVIQKIENGKVTDLK